MFSLHTSSSSHEDRPHKWGVGPLSCEGEEACDQNAQKFLLELDRTAKAKMLRKLRPAAAPVIAENDDEENVIIEYPIAMEYHGPLVTYAIPQVFPVNTSQIPIPALVSSASLLNNLSLPISNRQSSQIDRKVIRIDSSDALACDNGYESKPKLSHVIGSSGTLEVPDNDKEVEGFQDYMNPTNWESTESGLTSQVPWSEVFF